MSTGDDGYMNVLSKAIDDIINAYVTVAVKKERERCARIAETIGLGEPHSMPPYSIREYIAKEIRSSDNE